MLHSLKCYLFVVQLYVLPRTIAEVLPSLKCYLFVVQLYVFTTMKCYSLFYSSTCLPRTIAEVLPSLKCYLFVVQLYVLPASSVTSLQLSMLPPSAAEVSPCYHHQQQSLHVTKNNSRSITQPQVLPALFRATRIFPKQKTKFG